MLCLFKIEKGDQFQHISTENLFKLPRRIGVEKRPLDKLLSEDLGLHFSNNPNYSSKKTRNTVELVRFWKANLPFCQLAVIWHILTNQMLRCWADGGFEMIKRVCRRFFLVSPSSPLGHTTLVLPSSLHGQRNSIPPFCVRDD